MFALLTSHLACFAYGAALAWAATHWTAIKLAEATAKADIAKFFVKAGADVNVLEAQAKKDVATP
jgi:hypothetical protein